MEDEMLRVTWNTHQPAMISVFKSMYDSKTLVDCTLAAEGKSLKAHKVVISACSPYLKDLLSDHETESHPIIILNNTRFCDLENIMEYVYNGCVNVLHKNMASFLKTAEVLKIRGLANCGIDAGTSPVSHAKRKRRRCSTSLTGDDDKSGVLGSSENIAEKVLVESMCVETNSTTNESNEDELMVPKEELIEELSNQTEAEQETSDRQDILLVDDPSGSNELGYPEQWGEPEDEDVEVCEGETLQEQGVNFCLGDTNLRDHTPLERHIKKKYSVASGVGEPCLQCGRLFKYRANLENHVRLECGMEPTLKCSLCDAKFHFKAHLNEHLLTTHAEVEVGHHEVPSPSSPGGGGAGEELASGGKYACDLCPRAFTRIGSLNYHVSRKHSGASARDPSVFPFSCNQCNNRYKNSTQLCRHRRWECGKEPMFQCTQCVKKFHHRHGLKQHIRLHIAKSGEEPTALHYCCDKCGKGYKLKSSLNNHTKWECGKEPVFACTICLVKFSHKGNLKKHILTKHIR